MNIDIKQIIKIGEKLYNKGLVPGASGNISCKIDNKILITASGCSLGELTEQDIIPIDLEGNSIDKQDNPSSEKLMHVEIYKKRPDVNCIIHAHAPKSTTLAVAGKDLKEPLLAEGIISLGEVPLVKYETPSSSELAGLVAESFINNDAVLMANHGVCVCAKSLKEAFYNLETLEFLSEIYITTELLGNRTEIPADKLPDLMKIREMKKN